MISGLLTFLVGCLILVVVLYVFNLVLAQMTLPDPVKQIALLIVGLIGLVILIMITIQAFGGNAPPLRIGW